MSFPSLFAILFAPAHLRRRHAFAQWLPALAIALAGLLGSSVAQAAIYTFDGSAAVYGCSRAGMVYTCPYPAYLNGDDGIVIADGVTVRVTNNVIVQYGQGLQMSRTAKLIVTGYLDLSAINPANLKVTGGTIDVGGTMSVGAIAQTMTANIVAGAVQLGTDRVTINGTVTSRGVVNMSSYSRINAPIGSTAVSGTVITTGAGVNITGHVLATSRFTLESGSTVSGNVTAPVFDMRPASSKVTGNVLAATSVTMGSGNSIEGNVDTGDLLLQASNATITGNASVNSATLEWAGRVLGTIYCKNGTSRNKCDCVTNNSGYQINKTNGPTCESALPTGPHHFLITHDGVGDTCVPEQVTLLACANATCTAPHYTAGVSGTLGPFGTAFSIPANASTAVVNATRIPSGSVTLDVATATPAALWADTCYNDVKRTNSCAMEFLGGAKLILGPVGSHVAGESKSLAIKAVKQSPDQSACVSAFGDATYDVQYRCDYSKPKTGTVPLTLNGSALACNTAAATIQTRSTTFINGVASLPLAYADAGELDLSASVNTGKGITANGSTAFITAPKEFELVKPAGPLRAGADFSVTVRARNANDVVTKNFDTNALNGAGASDHTVALDVDCRAQAGEPGTLGTQAITFRDGEATVTTSWSEVGRIELVAKLTNFLGGGRNAAGTTRGALTSCPGNVGPFVPAYFTLSRPDGRPSYYSGEPFELQVSAMGAGGAPTKNYAHALGLSEAVTLSAIKMDGAAFALPVPGALAPVAVAQTAFINGVATVKPAYTFTAYPSSPMQIRLRATNGKTGALEVVSSAPASAEAQAMPFIRSGRLRLGNRVGNLRSPLSIPVTAEYWTGRSWLINDQDDTTVIPTDAFSFTPNANGMTLQKTFTPDPFKLTKGAAAITLQLGAGGPGWVDIAPNLGSAATDNACLGTSRPQTTGAGLPWLRSMISTCTPAGRRDPAGRATFGLLPPEQRRLIHVREVFN